MHLPAPRRPRAVLVSSCAFDQESRSPGRDAAPAHLDVATGTRSHAPRAIDQRHSFQSEGASSDGEPRLDAWGLGTIAQASQRGRTGDLEPVGREEREREGKRSWTFTDLV